MQPHQPVTRFSAPLSYYRYLQLPLTINILLLDLLYNESIQLFIGLGVGAYPYRPSWEIEAMEWSYRLRTRVTFQPSGMHMEIALLVKLKIHYTCCCSKGTRLTSHLPYGKWAITLLINFKVVEWHRPDRVTRQFGMQQSVPPLCVTSLTLRRFDHRAAPPLLVGRSDTHRWLLCGNNIGNMWSLEDCPYVRCQRWSIYGMLRSIMVRFPTHLGSSYPSCFTPSIPHLHEMVCSISLTLLWLDFHL